ncbi:MAG: hypothetical protein HC916_08945 [Coleofasciculaceae cyanobacterium SM2_1_6]|nr:hypothetical protein [Coleofasciculaceae cyanobacterium SM2_1_6]
MIRPIKIGLIAEGQTELGASSPFIRPQDGGKVIEEEKEGALHTLIRRELKSIGLSDCEFVHRHPTLNERKTSQLTGGYSILNPRYLKQILIAWKPEEVDMIVIVADADDVLEKRQRELEIALQTIRDNHLDKDEKLVSNRSVGGLAIRDFEAWLLADFEAVSRILGEKIDQMTDLENFVNSKYTLENAIAQSSYLAENVSNQRLLQVKWNLAFEINLVILKSLCPQGYGTFAENLTKVAEVTNQVLLREN